MKVLGIGTNVIDKGRKIKESHGTITKIGNDRHTGPFVIVTFNTDKVSYTLEDALLLTIEV